MMFTTLLLAASAPLAALAHSSHGSSHMNRHSSKRAVQTLDDSSTSDIHYTGKWTHDTLSEGISLSFTDAAEASYNFTTPKGAKGFVIKSTLKADRGEFKVLMDGKEVGNGTTRASGNSTGKASESKSEVIFKADIKDKSKHVWKVVKTSPKGTYLSVDAVEIKGVKVATSSSPLQGYFTGGNNFFLHAMEDGARGRLLDAMQDAGMEVARIFLTRTGSGTKGSASIEVKDVEPDSIGTYDDTILEKIDQLMVDASKRGIRLIIALHDRYALGFWGTDIFATSYGIVSGGLGTAQEVADASAFYTSSKAAQQMDARYTHIMNHKNKLMGGKRWADLSEAIYAVEAQNEPLGHMDMVSPNWVCDRSKTLKNLVGNSGILVSTGGGITTDLSLKSDMTDCDAYDIISVHDYGTDAGSTISALSAAKAKYGPQGKVVMFEEFGATGGGKAGQIGSFVQALKKAEIPWSYWEITDPGQGSNDFEVWTDEGDSWEALRAGSHKAKARRDTIVPAVGKSSRGVQRRSQASKRNVNKPTPVA